MKTILNAVAPAATYIAPGLGELQLPHPLTYALLKYVKGDETTIELKLEFSHTVDLPGAEVWHQETEFSAAAPAVASLKERQFSATGNYLIPIQQIGGVDKLRVSVKRTGGTGTGIVTVVV